LVFPVPAHRISAATVGSTSFADGRAMQHESESPITPRNSGKPDTGKPDAEVFEEADALDLHQQHPTGPEDGFGKLWRKLHHIDLTGADLPPEHVIATWKQHFGEFWPGQNRFYGPITALQPGELAVINIGAPPGTLSTGVRLAESTPTSFTLVTTKTHMLCGWLRFSADRPSGATTVSVEMLIRASDPIFEIGMIFGGHRWENHFWRQMLRNLAAHFGIAAEPESRVTCEDPHYRWENAKNIWHNGAIRNGLVRVAALPGKASDLLRHRRTERTS
jgi:hypothetical protein